MAAVVSLFVSGTVVGVMGTHLFYASRLGDPGHRMMRSEGYSIRLDQQLDLSAEQAEAIDDVITATREQAAELRQEMFPRVRDLMDEALEEIEQILTPEQREAYDRLRRFQRRGLEMLVLGPGGPGGPRGGPQRRGRRHGPPF